MSVGMQSIVRMICMGNEPSQTKKAYCTARSQLKQVYFQKSMVANTFLYPPINTSLPISETPPYQSILSIHPEPFILRDP